MIVLEFVGYGGRINIGDLSKKEVNNIKALNSFFDPKVFLNGSGTHFTKNGYKYEVFDFDQIINIDGVYLDTLINIYSDELKNNLIKSIRTDSINKKSDFEILSPLDEDKYYLKSVIETNGEHFCITLEDISIDEFDKDLLEIHYYDLSIYNINEKILTEVFYDGEQLWLDSSNSTSFEISHNIDIIKINNGLETNALTDLYYDGLKKIHINKNIFLTLDLIIEALDKFDNGNGYIDDSISKTFIYLSQFYYLFKDKDDIDALWLETDRHIKEAIKLNQLDLVPNDIIDRINMRFPEWLV